MKCKFANQIAVNLLACKCNNNYPQSHFKSFKYQTNNNKMGNVETFGEKTHIHHQKSRGIERIYVNRFCLQNSTPKAEKREKKAHKHTHIIESRDP